MYPFYGWTESYPHQRNQMALNQNNTPRFEAVPPYMKFPYEPWSYGCNNHGYPSPYECHSCCNHNHCGGGPYGLFRPPYPHFPPFHSHGGGYPPATYPVYTVPPHYSMEQPRCGYDQNTPKEYHCCGCPNHSCKRESGHDVVKVEEPEPGVEKRSADNSPFKNYPYPIVWIPPGYVKDAESRKHTEPEFKDEGRHNEEREKSFDAKRSNDHKQAGERSGLPFPIYWLPYMNNKGEKQGRNDGNSSQVRIKELPSFGAVDDDKHHSKSSEEISGSKTGAKVVENTEHTMPKVIPVKQIEPQDEKHKSRSSEEISGSKVGAKVVENTEHAMPKVIPVKQIEPQDEKKEMENKDSSEKGKLQENGGKKRQSSPSKTSKLPPICLRVDPLPRTKNGNGGSSRSPSPPANKERSDVPRKSDVNSPNPSDTSKEGAQCKSNIKTIKVMEHEPGKTDVKSPNPLDTSKEGAQGKSSTKTTKVAEHELRKDGMEDLCKDQSDRPVDSHENASVSEAEDKALDNKGTDSGTVTGREKAILEGNLSKEKTSVEEKNIGEEKRSEAKNLSESDAALIIQSAYRGYEVRKSEPLKKLRQIAEIEQRIGELKGHTSSNILIDDKQKLIIGETIMNLLLKLDTIQGLHPSVREIRKSVAKELVSLQEKLDSLTSRKLEVTDEDVSQPKHLDLSVSNPKNEDDAIQERQGEVASDDLPGSNANSKSDLSTEASGQTELSMPLLEDKQICEYHDVKPNNVNVDEGNDEQNDNKMETTQLPVSEASEDHLVKGTEEVSIELPLPPLSEEISSNNPLSNNVNVNKINDEQNDDKFDSTQLPISEASEDHLVTGVEEKISSNDTHSPLPDEKIGSNDAIETSSDLAPDNNKLLVELPDGEVKGWDEKIHIGEEDKVQVKGWDEKIHICEEDKVPLSELVEVEAALCNEKVVGMTQIEEKSKEMVEEKLPTADLQENRGKDGDEGKVENVPEVNMGESREIPQQGKDETKVDEAVESTETEEPNIQCEEEIFKECLGVKIIDEDNEEPKIQLEEIKESLGAQIVNEEASENSPSDQVTASIPEAPELPLEDFTAEMDRNKGERDSFSASEGRERKLMEENERLKEMMEKLIKAGNEQLTAISKLSGRVKDLEKKLSRKKKWKTRKCRAASVSNKSQMENSRTPLV